MWQVSRMIALVRLASTRADHSPFRESDKSDHVARLNCCLNLSSIRSWAQRLFGLLFQIIVTYRPQLLPDRRISGLW